MTRCSTLTGRCAAALLGLAGLMAAPTALSQTGSTTRAGTAGSSTEAPLGVQALIQRALGLAPLQQVAAEDVALARAQQEAARAVLRPQLAAQVSQLRQTTNPATLGFEFPGLPDLIGPYNVFDARLKLSQTVLDLARSSELAGAAFAVEAARAQAEVSAERIAANVALAYIQLLAADQALASAESDRALGDELLRLARDQKVAGVASGVDVARAETALAQDRYAVSEAQTRIAQARLQLQRLAVLPMDRDLLLAGSLDALPSAVRELGITAEQALNTARAMRGELRAADAALQQADAQRRAAQRRVLPRISAVADYGLSANTPSQNREDTYRYGAVIDVPIYSGGALRSEASAAEHRLQQQRLQLDELRQQIEQDVRLALATLANSAEQLRAAIAARDLAQRELELARDRFANGVANNVDVISAQASLTRARSQLIAASAVQQQARLNLAAAQGRARHFEL